MRVNVRWTGLIPWFATALLVGCSSTPEAPTQAQITQEVVVEASVLAVNAATREVTLERPDGTQLVVVAGPEVRNFDRIDAGDTVTARYVVSLSARLLGPEEADTVPVIELAAGRAEAGHDPAAGLGAGVAGTVRVESVDLEQHLVVFTDWGGGLRAIRAQRDEGKRFVAGLEPGDRVELVYGEAVILSVE